jgi:hypothetical protein
VRDRAPFNSSMGCPSVDPLQANLDKVVQHGKRADAIVKNMLLHSRQGEPMPMWQSRTGRLWVKIYLARRYEK